MTLAFGAPSLNHWTTREVPNFTIFSPPILLFLKKKKESGYGMAPSTSHTRQASQLVEEGAVAQSNPPVSLVRALSITWFCSLGVPLRLCTLLRKRAAPGRPSHGSSLSLATPTGSATGLCTAEQKPSAQAPPQDKESLNLCYWYFLKGSQVDRRAKVETP